MAKYHDTEIVSTDLTFNGESDWSAIEKEMVRLFDEVGLAYKGKKNRSLTVIAYSLKQANQVIYKEVLAKAPKIRPDILAGESPDRKLVSVRDPKYTIERSGHGKKWMAKGIVARRVVTFKHPVSEYVAALEYGRDEFMQPISKVNGNEISVRWRKVGKMEAQPFLQKALQTKSQQAVNVFSATLGRRWFAVLKRLNKIRGSS